MKKVLIISNFFPPLNNIAAKRYGIMCKYFEKNGYIPYIIAGAANSCYLGSKHDLEVPVPEKNIIRVNVEGKNIKSKGVKLLFDFWDKTKFRARIIDSRDVLWYENVIENIDLNKFKDIDIVIGTYGIAGNLYIAKYIAGKLGCPYIADLRDFISDFHVMPDGYKHFYQLDYIAERYFLSSADGIVTISPGQKKIIQRRYPDKKVVTIFNGWEGDSIENTCDIQEKYIYYAGSMYEHRNVGLKLLIKALKKVNEKENIKMIIRSIGPKALDRKAKKIIKQMGMEHCVRILPAATDDIVKAERSRSYINIVLSSVDEVRPEMQSILPGKTYEFMREKVPILAITSPKSDLARLLSYTDKGLGTTAVDEMVKFILNANGNFAGNRNVEKFSREKQASRLCKYMDYIIKTEAVK